jgi:hypothetical protein
MFGTTKTQLLWRLDLIREGDVVQAGRRRGTFCVKGDAIYICMGNNSSDSLSRFLSRSGVNLVNDRPLADFAREAQERLDEYYYLSQLDLDTLQRHPDLPALFKRFELLPGIELPPDIATLDPRQTYLDESDLSYHLRELRTRIRIRLWRPFIPRHEHDYPPAMDLSIPWLDVSPHSVHDPSANRELGMERASSTPIATESVAQGADVATSRGRNNVDPQMIPGIQAIFYASNKWGRFLAVSGYRYVEVLETIEGIPVVFQVSAVPPLAPEMPPTLIPSEEARRLVAEYSLQLMDAHSQLQGIMAEGARVAFFVSMKGALPCGEVPLPASIGDVPTTIHEGYFVHQNLMDSFTPFFTGASIGRLESEAEVTYRMTHSRGTLPRPEQVRGTIGLRAWMYEKGSPTTDADDACSDVLVTAAHTAADVISPEPQLGAEIYHGPRVIGHSLMIQYGNYRWRGVDYGLDVGLVGLDPGVPRPGEVIEASDREGRYPQSIPLRHLLENALREPESRDTLDLMLRAPELEMRSISNEATRTKVLVPFRVLTRLRSGRCLKSERPEGARQSGAERSGGRWVASSSVPGVAVDVSPCSTTV